MLHSVVNNQSLKQALFAYDKYIKKQINKKGARGPHLKFNDIPGPGACVV
jgi:hypothetical protein